MTTPVHLTPAQVKEIRQRHLFNGEKQAALAAIFGVSQATISRAVRGLTHGPKEAR